VTFVVIFAKYFGKKGIFGYGKSYSPKGEPRISIVMDDSDMPYLISSVRKGIGYPDFEKMVAFSSFTLPEWSSILHLTERSLQRYKQQKQTSTPYSPKKSSRLFSYSKKVLPYLVQKKKFDTWLNTNIVSLGGILPKEVLDSAFGIEWIMDELGRIEHGTLA
jgi:putative toxin-antitoxin system antitoxin component (TIGR02293 family)